MVNETNREAKLHQVRAALDRLHRSLEVKIREAEGREQRYVDFLDDVIAYLHWTDEKFDYRYAGNNSRSVLKGEIYYCDLGENIGSEQNKTRPVLVLQNDTGNRYAPTTIVAPITNTPKKLPVHLPLTQVQEGLSTTGVLRMEHIRAVAKCRLGVFIEKIDTQAPGWRKIERTIKKSLDLS